MLGLEPGDKVALDADSFQRLAQAFLEAAAKRVAAKAAKPRTAVTASRFKKKMLH